MKRDFKQEALQVHLKRIGSQFKSNEMAKLEELIISNINYYQFPKDYTPQLLEKYINYEKLLKKLNNKKHPLIGHRIKIICQNKKTYENASITSIKDTDITIMVQGGNYIHDLTLSDKGLSMSNCGGYSLTVPITSLTQGDMKKTTFKFSGQSRVEPNGAIEISKPIKRWFIDDSNGELQFY